MSNLVNVNTVTMSSLEIAELVGARHDSVKQSIERLVKREVIQLPTMAEVKNHLGQTIKFYEINKRDSLVIVAQLSPEFTGKLVDRWQELEAQQAPAIKAPTTYIEALQALIVAEQAKEEAIRTKAEIGSRREATAMNTASQAVKRVNDLEIQLDKSKDYYTVKRMEMIHHGVKFNWRLLKSTSNQMEIEPVDVFDQNYGTVKAYHKDVWKEAYAIAA